MSVCSSPVPRTSRDFVLVAHDGEQAVARLTGTWLAADLFQARRIDYEEGADASAALAAFAAAVASTLSPGHGEVLVWEKPDQASWRAALEGRGFQVLRRKAFVERDLTAELPPAPGGLSLHSLADAGESAFVKRMYEASEGDPFEERKGRERDLSKEWRELVDGAEERFDPARWYLVDDEQGPVGVLLPQAVDDRTGSLFYVGVLPARRGAGLGRGLHARGLALLSEAGLARYVGSTDFRNAPMRRVFFRNGCREIGIQAFLALSPDPAPPKRDRSFQNG